MPPLRARPPWEHRSTVPLAVAVGVVQVAGSALANAHNHDRLHDFDVLAAVLLALGPIALVWRRRYPVAVLTIAFLSTLAYATIYGAGPIWLSLGAAYVNAVFHGRRPVAIATLPAGFIAFPWVPWLLGDAKAPSIAGMIGLAAWLTVMAVGTELAVTRRRQALEAVRVAAAERKREASDERLRIAREVHDVVAHNISLINVQAGVALHLIDERPEQVRTALAAIKDASRETLEELKSVVDALRGDDEAAPTAPTPGLADIERLVARTSDAGLPVRLETDRLHEPVPAGVDLAAYRIVQEALTNATRHAGAASVVVRVRRDGGALDVEVVDDGRGDAPDGGDGEHVDGAHDRHVGGAGRGIAGMRERASALGGSFEAGPRRDATGFRVHARLPLNGHGGD
jgi:signal transduction histidine kinase